MVPVGWTGGPSKLIETFAAKASGSLVDAFRSTTTTSAWELEELEIRSSLYGLIQMISES